MTFEAIEFKSELDAIQWADAGGQGKSVLIDGRPMVMKQSEIDRLAAAGVPFAYLHDHQMRDGSYRIMTVPVN